MSPATPTVLLLTLAASLAAGAACGILEPEYDLFEEERRYTHVNPGCVATNPEMPCTGEVTFCPGGNALHSGAGGDIVESGTYRIFGSRVRLTLPLLDQRLYFTLLEGGSKLLDDELGREWVLATDGAFCPESRGQ